MTCEELPSYPSINSLKSYLRDYYHNVDVRIATALKEELCDEVPHVILDKHIVTVGRKGGRGVCSVSLYRCLHLPRKARHLVSEGGVLRCDLVEKRPEDEIFYMGNYTPRCHVEGRLLQAFIRNFLRRGCFCETLF